MIKIAVENAVGMTLCHDVTVIKDGYKGPLYKRGHVIAPADIPQLLNIGKHHIFVWEENAGEIHEEDCALRFAAMAPVPHSHYIGPSEGKVTLISDTDGLFCVDTVLLKALNSIQDITITALPNHYPIKKGSRIASMRIIPLVTKEANIVAAETLCRGNNLFRILPYQLMKVGIIITGSEVYNGLIKDKFESIARDRLASYPCEILGATICSDDSKMITDAANEFLESGVDLLIFHGGMSVDPDDLTPTTIRSLGADIITYGVPAQPGNMSLIAYLGNTTILGVPSSAISNRTSMFDVVLPQVFSGKRFTKDELLNLGNGSLCQQCETCHFPNCTFGKY